MMKRDEMLKTFARQRKDEIVVAVYTAAQELTHIQPSDLNYTFVVSNTTFDVYKDSTLLISNLPKPTGICTRLINQNSSMAFA